MGLGGSGAPLNSPPRSNLINLSESVKIFGFPGMFFRWQLVFALCHRLISNNNNKNQMPKGGPMVMAMANIVYLAGLAGQDSERKPCKQERYQGD